MTHELPELAPRPPESHKGNYGRTLVVGGSRGMAGAAALAGMAALRSGAGLVTVATADPCLDTVAAFDPCYMTVGLHSDLAGRIAGDDARIQELIAAATCVACGPGLGRSTALDTLVRFLFDTADRPMVLDADALNALAADRRGLGDHPAERIVTPHPGEFRRLAGTDGWDRAAGERRAIELAGQWRVVMVLKGHRTLITDGTRSTRNATGNPGMATGGSGDVLTGVLAALVGQGLNAYDAAVLGCWVHGRAGDLAARERGEVGMTARDIVDRLPAAFLERAAADFEQHP